MWLVFAVSLLVKLGAEMVQSYLLAPETPEDLQMFWVTVANFEE